VEREERPAAADGVRAWAASLALPTRPHASSAELRQRPVLRGHGSLDGCEAAVGSGDEKSNQLSVSHDEAGAA